MRNHSITIAKAIAIILVVMAHSRCPVLLQNWLCMFVMPYYVSAILLTLTVFHLSEWIAKNKNCVISFLIFTGDHTMDILTWHLLSLKLVSLLLIALYGLPIKQLSEFPVIEEYARQGWWVLYLCIGVGIPIIGTYYYHRLKDAPTCNNQ